MGIVKVLKRKDGASLVVGIALAMIIFQFLTMVTPDLAAKLSGLEDGQYSYVPPGSSWQGQYLNPAVNALLQIVILELLVWIYVGIHSLVVSSKKK